MFMLMLMILLKNKPDADEHKGSRNDHLGGEILLKDKNGRNSTNEGRGAEAYAGS